MNDLEVKTILEVLPTSLSKSLTSTEACCSQCKKRVKFSVKATCNLITHLKRSLPSQHTVKPLIEHHPVFSKITVSDLLTRIPLQLLSLLQRFIFSCFFFIPC